MIMKMNYTATLSKEIRKGVRRGTFMWACNPFYIIFTTDKYVLFKIERTEEMVQGLNAVRPPVSYESLLKIVEYYRKMVVVHDIRLDDFHVSTEPFIYYRTEEHDYFFNSRLIIPKWKTSRYTFELFVIDNYHYGLYVIEHDIDDNISTCGFICGYIK